MSQTTIAASLISHASSHHKGCVRHTLLDVNVQQHDVV